MKVRAVLDSGAPLVILSSKFVKKIPFKPDVSYDKIFGTAGNIKVQFLGVYYLVHLKFGSLVITTPAIVLQLKGYDMHTGSDFFDTYDTTMCHKEGIFKIMGHSFPLLKIDGSLHKSPSQGNFKSTMLVHCSSGDIGVAIDNKDTSCYLPKEMFFEDPIILRCRDKITIFSKKKYLRLQD